MIIGKFVVENNRCISATDCEWKLKSGLNIIWICVIKYSFENSPFNILSTKGENTQRKRYRRGGCKCKRKDA